MGWFRRKRKPQPGSGSLEHQTEYWKQYMAQERRMTPDELLDRRIAEGRMTGKPHHQDRSR
jgi:hypothetical protein